MATKNLIRKYADTLAAMEKDAAQNFQEAHSEFQQVQVSRKDAEAELKNLKDTMKEKHRGFYGAAKAIIGMTFKRPETPEEIEAALEPIIGYQAAMAAVPSAEETLNAAQEAEKSAYAEMRTAENVWNTFTNVRGLYPSSEDQK